MCNTISVTTQSKDYQNPQKRTIEKEATDTPSTSTPPSSGPLHIERPNNESVSQPPPKGVLQKLSYNPNAKASQHYNIIKNLAQAPLALPTLEDLQNCPTQ